MKDTICPKCSTQLLLNDRAIAAKRLKCPDCASVFQNPHYFEPIVVPPKQEIAYRSYEQTPVDPNEPIEKNFTPNKLSKNEKTGLIALIIFVIIILFAIFTPEHDQSSEVWYVTQTTYVATSKESFDELFRYLNNRDYQAINSLIYTGNVTTLTPGTELFVVRGGFSSSVVRRKGSRQNLWIVNEHMSQRR